MRQVTFSEDGPLGIVWSQVLEGQRIDYSYIKSVRPASQAAAQPDCVAGLVLGYIDGAWCQNADYDATIEIIRAAGRPGPPRPAPPRVSLGGTPTDRRRGAWARVSVGRYRHSALRTVKGRRASTNILSAQS